MACTHVYASPICACNVSVANETRYDEFEGERGGVYGRFWGKKGNGELYLYYNLKTF